MEEKNTDKNLNSPDTNDFGFLENRGVQTSQEQPKSFYVYFPTKETKQIKSFHIYLPGEKSVGQEKRKALNNLESELIRLGTIYGDKMELADPNIDQGVEIRGIVRKEIKEGLLMEYAFSSPIGGVKSISLNNVSINLEELTIEEITKLYKIIKNLISQSKEEEQQRKKSMKKPEMEKEEIDTASQRKKREILKQL